MPMRARNGFRIVLTLSLILAFSAAPMAAGWLAGAGGGGAESLYTVSRRQAVIDFIAEHQMPEGGFVGSLGEARRGQGVGDCRDAAVALGILGAFDAIDREALINFLVERQLEDGGFEGIIYDRYETILVSCLAVQALDVLGALGRIDGDALGEWVMSCYWADGSFNNVPIDEYRAGWRLTNTEDAVKILWLIDSPSSPSLGGMLSIM